MRTGFFTKISVFVVATFAGILCAPLTVHAQGADIQAIALKKEAMAAYGNLDLDTAVNKLDQAAAMGAQLSANTVAQIYVSYGIVYVGGQGDNARGQDFFTIARCLDASISIDPLFSTPEVDMIFKMAQARADQQTCAAMLANVAYMGNPGTAMPPAQPMPVQPMPAQPMPVQPMPVQPMPQAGGLPPCGIHNSPMQQRKSTELPLMVQVDPAKLVTLDRIVLRYAYDGAATYFEMDMKKGDQGWVTALLSCDQGQLTAFDPTTINYYIEGYDMIGGLVCGHGSSAQPFAVNMNPGAPIVTGLAGMPTPQMCTECPPWDQDCHAAKGEGVPCFSDEECLEGQWCSDTGYCEGGGGGEGGFDEFGEGVSAPKVFYINVSAGFGLGYANTPNQWYVASGYLLEDENDQPSRENFYSYLMTGVDGGSAGAVPLRVQLGFMLSPKLSLELGGRFDFSAIFRKQTNVLFCADNPNAASHGDLEQLEGDEYECVAPLSDRDGAFGAFWDNRTSRVAVADSKNARNGWLANIRMKYRFVNNKGNQFYMVGGLGYGHLFINPKIVDMDADGTTDKMILTPGMINIETGIGFAHYSSRNVGFFFELPVDLVVGEESSFGVGVDLMAGISFGG